MVPVTMPALRPGAVIHGPKAMTDTLLGDFAGELQRRGFKVAGLIQRNLGAGDDCACAMELVDMASGEVIRISQDLGAGSTSCRVDPAGIAEAGSRLRSALDGKPDLVVVNKFGALEKDGGGLADELLWAMAEGLPVLTSVAGRLVGEWLEFCGGHCDLLRPDPAALWQWWGGQRLYRDLLLGVVDRPVGRIVRSAHWMLVEGSDACGLARLPRGADQAGRPLEAYAERGLGNLAGLVQSTDLFEAAVGLAALNAHYNRPDLEAGGGNGLDAFAAEEGRVVCVGAFPDISRRMPHALVIDAQPAAGEYPAAAADFLLPGCAAAVITASTLANRSLPRLLDLARGSRVALAGPGTPLTPRLFSYGVEILAGFVVDDPDGMVRSLAEGATPRGFRTFGRQVTLRRPE
ncbi:DUF2478 domain-containing protein [Skermanella pratensis]|uniref:DUF2478 domain-containing protein n=1 Tax=Skermanella pratensis TaxID=2233999 RepID=UPI001FE40207|nr:DUF2478 domain-containing protein [Skermanella pratensis]